MPVTSYRVASWVCFHLSPTLCESSRPPQEWGLRLSGVQLPTMWTHSHPLEASSESTPLPVFEAVFRDPKVILKPSKFSVLLRSDSYQLISRKEKPQADFCSLCTRASSLPVPQGAPPLYIIQADLSSWCTGASPLAIPQADLSPLCPEPHSCPSPKEPHPCTSPRLTSPPGV